MLSHGAKPGIVLASRYEIGSLLGRGGMGVVYRAFDRVLDETVAIKVLEARGPDWPDLARRFRTEIKLARKVSHWNVCRIHDYGEDGPLAYISMELVDGITLKQVLADKGPLPADEAFAIALQVADGLEAIHRAGILHRDLKTSNLMREAAGRVRIMDFGVARSFNQPLTALTATSVVAGTPEYMSPEQIRGERLDVRSDVYSFGVVLYEMLTARLPHRGSTPIAVMVQILEQPPSLDTAAEVPLALRPLLRKALAKRRADRYASAREMTDAIRASQANLLHGDTATATVPARDPSPTPTWRVGARAWRRAAAGVAVGAASLSGFWLLNPARPVPDESERARRRPDLASRPPGHALAEAPTPPGARVGGAKPPVTATRRQASASRRLPSLPAAEEEDPWAAESAAVGEAGDAMLPVGTLLLVRVLEELRSDRVRAGQLFAAALEEPVVWRNSTVLPAGTRLTGKIDAVTRPGEPPFITIRVIGIESDGRPQPIRTTSYELRAPMVEGRPSLGAVVIGTLVGATVGAVVGGRDGLVAGGGAGGAVGAATRAGSDRSPAEFVLANRLPFKLVEPAPLAGFRSTVRRRAP